MFILPKGWGNLDRIQGSGGRRMDKQINPARDKELGGSTRDPSCVSGALGSVLRALMLYFLLAGCIPSTPDAYWFPTSDPAWSTPEKEIERAERKWNRKQISSYRMKVRVWRFWDDQSYAVVIHEGKVVDSSSTCVPAGSSEPCCTACFKPEDFTVPGLFAAARAKASMAKITFNPYYGFPSKINYNNTALADEEEEWIVLEFQPENP
jgi:hypothetical protein